MMGRENAWPWCGVTHQGQEANRIAPGWRANDTRTGRARQDDVPGRFRSRPGKGGDVTDVFKGTPFQFGAWALTWQKAGNPYQRLSLWPDTFAGDLPDKNAEVVSVFIHDGIPWGQVDAMAMPDGKCQLRLVDDAYGHGAAIWRRCLIDLLKVGLLETTEQPAATDEIAITRRKPGRPSDTRTVTKQEFLAAVDALLQEDEAITQAKLGKFFSCDEREIRRWCDAFGISWKDIRKPALPAAKAADS